MHCIFLERYPQQLLFLLKFSFSEKATKIWSYLPLSLTNNSKCQTMWKITSNFCSFLRKAELYQIDMLCLFDDCATEVNQKTVFFQGGKSLSKHCRKQTITSSSFSDILESLTCGLVVGLLSFWKGSDAMIFFIHNTDQTFF